MTVSDRVSEGVPQRRAGRREWIGLAVLALPMLLVSMDLTVLHQAFTEGLQLAAGVGATAMLGMAVLAAIVLRREQASSDSS